MVTGIRRRVPLSVPVFGGREAEYLSQCLDSSWVSTAGPWVGRFEKCVAEYLGVGFGVATSTGTAALHTALLVAGVGQGDAVLVPDLTFIAPVNAIRYCGAEPIFIDVDRTRWQLDPEAVRAFLTEETEPMQGGRRDRRSGRRVKAILAVHLLGLPAPIESLLAIAAGHELVLVQDAAQAIGAERAGRKVGSFGGVTALSFNGNKIVTSGAGGMIVTSDSALADRARYLTTQAKDDPLYFRHDAVGFNYRLTSLHAALGLAQMEQLDGFIVAKRAVFARYQAALSARSDVHLVEEGVGDRAIYWLTSLTVDGGRERRDRVLHALREAGVEARPPWQVNHTQQPYRDARRGAIDRAAVIADEGLQLPSSASLSNDDQAYVLETLELALRQ